MNDINNALEELKRSLEKVDSARQQSQNTIKAYSDLQNEVAEYISKFTDIAGELESVKKLLDEEIQAIDSQGKDILNKLSSKCSILVSDLQIKLSKETQKFQDFSNKEINKIIDTEKNLEKKISELTVLHNNIQRTLKAMNDLGTKFDNWKNLSENNVSEIKMILSEVKSSLLSLESSINNGVQSLKKDILSIKNTLIAEIDAKATSTSTSISTSESNIKNTLSSTGSAISDKIDSVKSVLESSINNGVQSLKKDILSIKNALIAEIDAKATSTSTSISTSESNIKNTLSSTGSAIFDKIDSVKSVLESSINNSVQSLKKDISFVENTLNKIITATNKKFMWIGIAIIVMVLVDIILHFI